MRFTVEPSPAGGFHVRDRFGDESRYRRFMAAKKHLGPGELAHLTEVDHVDHEAIGALHPRTGAGLGVARYLRNPDRPETAEAAVAVIDDWQGRGLGGVLLRRLCAHAKANGIEAFTASLLTENRSMLHLFERLGKVIVREFEGAAMEIDVELPIDDMRMLLRSAATNHVRPSDRAGAGG
jgi:GNAT superfamily N-acetyltransferase